ncbi:MAG: phosphatidate cytidylyltransferase, partial [Gammaproteobacteria bacterium]
MSKWDTLKLRIVTAVILFLLLAAATTQLPPFYFAVIIALIVLRAGWEWTRFLTASSRQGRLLYIASLAIMMAGIFPLLGIFPGASAIDELRATMILGLGQFFWLFSVVLLKGYPQNRNAWNDDSHIAAMGLVALL